MADRSIPPLSATLLRAEKLVTAWSRFFTQVGTRADAGYFASQLGGSYPTGLTITGVAASASITISAHSRVYPTVTVSVDAGSVLTLSYGSTYYVYFDQESRSGGTVVYAATTTLTDAFASSTYPDRHYIGRVTMPANGAAANTVGVPARPPGYSAS